MYDKVMTLWTFSKDQDSIIIDEAFSLNCEGKFAYKNMQIKDVLNEGWKTFVPPIKTNKYFVWWLFKD